MQILNLNVFTSLLMVTSYFLSWILGFRLEMLIIPRGSSRIIFGAVLLVVASFLIFVWARRGLVKPSILPRAVKLIQFGHFVMAIANLILIFGIVLFLLAASTSEEDEYWFGLVMTSFIGPVGCVLAVVGLAMVQLVPFGSPRRKGAQ